MTDDRDAVLHHDTLLARSAYERVRAARDADYGDELRSRLQSLGPMLQSAGLAATLAFLRAKAETGAGNARQRAYLDTYLALGDHLRPVLGRGDDEDLLQTVIPDVTPAEYRLAGAEARRLAGWLARAAAALVSDEEEKETTQRDATGSPQSSQEAKR